jgi:ribosomal protein L14E/L6E/L27E
MAYRKGKILASHVRQGYKSLSEAYKHTERHVQLLDNYVVKVGSAREEIGVTLNAAFKKLLKVELAEAKQLQQGAAAAEWAEKKARKAERYAAAQVRRA